MERTGRHKVTLKPTGQLHEARTVGSASASGDLDHGHEQRGRRAQGGAVGADNADAGKKVAQEGAQI